MALNLNIDKLIINVDASEVINLFSKPSNTNRLAQPIVNIDGCFPYFLEIVSVNLDSKKNIRTEALSAVAEKVNRNFEALNLTPFDVQEIWVEVKEHWKVWSAVLETVDENCIDWTTGTITLSHPSEWETILSEVPDTVVIKSEGFFCAGQVRAILNEPSGQNSKKLKKNKSDEGCSSAKLMQEEKKEIRALMNSLGKVSKLNVLLEHVLFSMTLFKSKKSREDFKSYRTDDQKFKFVDDEYKKHSDKLLQPPAP